MRLPLHLYADRRKEKAFDVITAQAIIFAFDFFAFVGLQPTNSQAK